MKGEELYQKKGKRSLWETENRGVQGGCSREGKMKVCLGERAVDLGCRMKHLSMDCGVRFSWIWRYKQEMKVD